MIDFGLSKRYMARDKHIKMIKNKGLIGSARYASIPAHAGHEQGRRDDCESICYLLLYFMHRG